ncbi:hypothetical protein DQW77_11435 [Roseovarius sp. TE539]|uniref:phosphotransferase n=1 Tax=Roseovarius sp. TE539 TaxID=2249812 RepID=UPI000DDF3F84|nr:hypothetical protein DQW77_11435 [Roseovarius sp. TE539]
MTSLRRPEHSLDAGKRDRRLRSRLTDLNGPVRIRRISGGQSDATDFVSYDTRELVLRRKPEGRILPSAHALDPEFRVQKALAEKTVRTPRRAERGAREPFTQKAGNGG